MKIVVLAGGLSTERNVSLSSGTMVAQALRERGHQVALADLFFGLEDYSGTLESLYDAPILEKWKKVSTQAPDLDAVIAARKKKSPSIFGDRVIDLCRTADVTFLALHGGSGEDGRGIAAAFMLGAEAVQMGTRFLVAKECTVHQNYKDRVLKAKDIDSTVTGRTHGHPVRCLRNQMTREYVKLENEGKSFEELEYLTLGTLRKAVQEGDVTNGTVMAGQIAGMVSKEQTCKEMIDEMMAQAETLLGRK